MYIAYFDETGDDGYPVYSSELFILTSLYMHSSNWKENYYRIYEFRKELKANYGFPIKEEFHAKEFITDKDPYHGKYTANIRKEIIFRFFQFIPSLDIKIISVAIDKQKIQRPEYNVLKKALTYNVQRIENDLIKTQEKFLIITDEGRVSAMRNITRSIQKINYIPTGDGSGSYRKEIKCLIEDPLPKPSNESFFIQLVDLFSFIINLYVKQNLCVPKLQWGKRILNVLDYGNEITLLDLIRGKLNTKASKSNEYGIVYYPK
ncbi:MAG: DUF3800 domain-containing protein [Lentimicrobiaceae bacterium]|nr:DUF3800 domain-containing protein [Lentimicrobiaceae bacterium]